MAMRDDAGGPIASSSLDVVKPRVKYVICTRDADTDADITPLRRHSRSKLAAVMGIPSFQTSR
jgi:hypothetical protein